MILFLLYSTFCSFGQNVDSLYNRYNETLGNRRVAIANEIAQAVFALECTDTLFHIENTAKPELVAAIVNELMATYNEYIRNDYTKAIHFSLDAAKRYEQSGDIRAMNLNYSNTATRYFHLGNYEKAIDLMLKCYEIDKQRNDAEAMSSTLNNLAVAYKNWGYRETAIEYYRQSLEIERPLNRPMQYAKRLAGLAGETSYSGNHTEALQLIKEALVYAEKIERKEREERIAVHQRQMGDIYVAMDSLPQAEECYKLAGSVFEKNNRQQMLCETLLSLGRLQLKQNRMTEAKETLQYCITICEKIRLLGIWRDAVSLLYEAYKQTGHTAQALSYLEQYRELNDSIFRETTRKQISEFQVKYETAEKELEIERQHAEISRQNARQNSLIVGLSVATLLLLLLIYIVRLRTRRNRELAETNATKDKFFSIISHDLKNPAVAQRDALQLLLENSGNWDATSLTKYYQKLLKSANGQVDLLYTLLNWAQLQAGRMPYNPTLFDLTTALQSCICLIKNMAENKGVTFDVLTPETALVTGDYNMLTTVVRNLLVNAVKFTPAGGTVTLTVSGEVLGANAISGAHASAPLQIPKFNVSISDTGIGMTGEQISNLFRLDRHRSTKGTSGEKGSGLGLIICNELLQKHNAQLRIESEPGKGSRFWFELTA